MMAGLPQELAVIIGLLEVVGGILLVTGILTRITSFLFVIEMIGAFIIINVSNGISLPEGYEFAILSVPIPLMAISISLVLTGPGGISIEWDIKARINSIWKRDYIGSKRKAVWRFTIILNCS